MTRLITTLGPIASDQLSMILPHEHVFVDLRTWDQPGYAQAEVDEVVQLMAPEIERAKQSRVSLIVECSTVGVGRRADIDRAVSEATKFPLVVPTGIYREPWIPDWVHTEAEESLADWMLSELQGEIEGSGVQAGWIKLSAGDEGLTETETKVLRAAAKASRETNAVIGSHTIKGRVVRNQLDILEEMGAAPDRFIWIHTQAEPEFGLHLEMARRGCWIEYDWIGGDGQDDGSYVRKILGIIEAGCEDRLLLSQDRGWYDPAQPGGGVPVPYTYLSEKMLPQLEEAGVGADMIHQLTHINPCRAFAR